MKQLFLTVFAIFAAYNIIAQTGSAKQVKWAFTSKKVAENTFEVRMTANIMGNYHMYAQQAGAEGPIPTSFTFSPNPLVSFDGKVKEQGKLIKKYESAWPGTVNYYEKKVDFVQIIKLKGKVKTSLSGKVEFVVCNDSECLPPSEVEFKIAAGG
jgi:thiol:disulfide interchange protein DsbD